MRILASLLIASTFSGCASEIAREPIAPLLSSAKCAAVAQQRMQDAAANGYDGNVLKASFDFTYTDCVKWETTHPEN